MKGIKGLIKVAAGVSLAAMVIITAVLISTSKVEEFRIGGRGGTERSRSSRQFCRCLATDLPTTSSRIGWSAWRFRSQMHVR